MTKILIVEDEAMIADNLQALLEAKGYKVFLAKDGKAAVDAARKEKPDIILLDIMLPRLGGFDVCRILRGDSQTTAIKIIVTTGLGRMGDVETAFDAGANDYLVKPYDSQRLLHKIEKVLGK